MKLTPLDIKQKKFKKKYDRYDADEVDSFLEEVRIEFEECVRDNQRVSDDNKRLQDETNRLREEEKLIKEALVSIQRFSEELRETAKREAELMVSEAELEAETIISRAQLEASRIREDVNELIRQRIQFEESLKRLLDVHRKLLEATVAHDVPLPEPEDTNGKTKGGKKKGK